MTFQEYVQLFDDILASNTPQPPYNKPDYLHYTRLNLSRMNRWLKTMQLDEDVVNMLKNMNERQHWMIIVEPWCGDVSHSLPFLVRLAEQSPMITYDLQLRDSEPFLINTYLTNGTKSIPKLIVRDAEGHDLFTWGARPKAAQQLMERLKATGADFDTVKEQLQKWYNQDKGRSLQQELKEKLQEAKSKAA